jgi:hypothetical protein
MSVHTFSDKFIAFVDILGFSQIVEEAEQLPKHDFACLLNLTQSLGSSKDAMRYAVDGPHICPKAPYTEKGLDFRVTQVSDCIIVSCEISPASVIALIGYCHSMSVRLMQKHALVRGMITRGNILHRGTEVFGTGYNRAVYGEKGVTAFATSETNKGGPFIEIDPRVSNYVREQPNRCVRDMFARLTHGDGSVTAIYPFHTLAESHFATVDERFDPHQWLASVRSHRDAWLKLRDVFDHQTEGLDEHIVAKTRHYRDGINHIIGRAEDRIRSLNHMIVTGRIPYGTSWTGL